MDPHADARDRKRRKRIYGMTVNNNNMRRQMREQAAKQQRTPTPPPPALDTHPRT